MMKTVRVSSVLLLALGLTACAASQTAGAPEGAGLGAPAAPAAPAARSPHRKMHGNDIVGGAGGRFALLQILLGDTAMPNGYAPQAINIGVDSISVADAAGNVSQVAQYATPQVVNVLNYQNGNTTPIGSGSVATTTYASLTLVVDTASSTYVNRFGYVSPLQFATGGSTQSTSGFGSTTTVAPGPQPGTVAITFNQPFQVAGSSPNIDVDFNVMESVRPAWGGPSVRAALSVAQRGLEGSISGTVQNQNGGPVVNAVVTATDASGNVQATAFTDSNGNFLLHTLVAGTYTLTAFNHYVSASGMTINSYGSTSSSSWGWPQQSVTGPPATVTPGQTTSAGTIAD